MKISSKEDIFSIRTDSPDLSVLTRIKKNWDKLAKPLDSLGDFEALVSRIGAIQCKVYPDV